MLSTALLLLLSLAAAPAAAQNIGSSVQLAPRDVSLNTVSAATSSSEVVRLTVSDTVADDMPVRYDAIVWQVEGDLSVLGRLVQAEDSSSGVLDFSLHDENGLLIPSEIELRFTAETILLIFTLPTTVSLSTSSTLNARAIYSLRAAPRAGALGVIDNALYVFTLRDITLGGQPGADLPVPINAQEVSGTSAQLRIRVIGTQLIWPADLPVFVAGQDFLLLNASAGVPVALAVGVADRYGNLDVDAAVRTSSLVVEVQVQGMLADTRWDELSDVRATSGIITFRWARWPEESLEYADLFAVVDAGGSTPLRTTAPVILETDALAERLVVEDIRIEVSSDPDRPAFSVNSLLDRRDNILRFRARAVAGGADCQREGVRPCINDILYAEDLLLRLTWDASQFALAVDETIGGLENSLIAGLPGNILLSNSGWTDGETEMVLAFTPALAAAVSAQTPTLSFSLFSSGTDEGVRFSRAVARVIAERLLVEGLHISVRNELSRRISSAEALLQEDLLIDVQNALNQSDASADSLQDGRDNILRFTVRAAFGEENCQEQDAPPCLNDPLYAEDILINLAWDESRFSLAFAQAADASESSAFPDLSGIVFVYQGGWTGGKTEVELILNPVLLAELPEGMPELLISILPVQSGTLRGSSFSETVAKTPRAGLRFEDAGADRPVPLDTAEAGPVRLAIVTVAGGTADGVAAEYDTLIWRAMGQASILQALGDTLTLTLHEERAVQSESALAVAYGHLVTDPESGLPARRIIFTRPSPVRLEESTRTVSYTLQAQYESPAAAISDNSTLAFTLQSIGLASRVPSALVDTAALADRTVAVRAEVVGTELRWLDTGDPALDFNPPLFLGLRTDAGVLVSLGVEVTDIHGNRDLDVITEAEALSVEVHVDDRLADTRGDVLTDIQPVQGAVTFRWARWPEESLEYANLFAVADAGGSTPLRTTAPIILETDALAERLVVADMQVIVRDALDRQVLQDDLVSGPENILRFTLRGVAGQEDCLTNTVRPCVNDILYAPNLAGILLWEESQFSLLVEQISRTNGVLIDLTSQDSWTDGAAEVTINLRPTLIQALPSTLRLEIRDRDARLEVLANLIETVTARLIFNLLPSAQTVLAGSPTALTALAGIPPAVGIDVMLQATRIADALTPLLVGARRGPVFAPLTFAPSSTETDVVFPVLATGVWRFSIAGAGERAVLAGADTVTATVLPPTVSLTAPAQAVERSTVVATVIAEPVPPDVMTTVTVIARLENTNRAVMRTAMLGPDRSTAQAVFEAGLLDRAGTWVLQTMSESPYAAVSDGTTVGLAVRLPNLLLTAESPIRSGEAAAVRVSAEKPGPREDVDVMVIVTLDRAPGTSHAVTVRLQPDGFENLSARFENDQLLQLVGTWTVRAEVMPPNVLAVNNAPPASVQLRVLAAGTAGLEFTDAGDSRFILLDSAVPDPVPVATVTVLDEDADGAAVRFDTIVWQVAGSADALLQLRDTSRILLSLHGGQGARIESAAVLTSTPGAVLAAFVLPATASLNADSNNPAVRSAYTLHVQLLTASGAFMDNSEYVFRLEDIALSSGALPVLIDLEAAASASARARVTVTGTELRWLDTAHVDFSDPTALQLTTTAGATVLLAVEVTDGQGSRELDVAADTANLEVKVFSASPFGEMLSDAGDSISDIRTDAAGRITFSWTRWPGEDKEEAVIRAQLRDAALGVLNTAGSIRVITEAVAERLLVEDVRAAVGGLTVRRSLLGGSENALHFIGRAVDGDGSCEEEGAIRPCVDDIDYAGDNLDLTLNWMETAFSLEGRGANFLNPDRESRLIALLGFVQISGDLMDGVVVTLPISSSWTGGRVQAMFYLSPMLTDNISQSVLRFKARNARADLEPTSFTVTVTDSLLQLPPASILVTLKVSPSPAAPGAWVALAADGVIPIGSVRLSIEASKNGGRFFIPAVTAADASTSPLTITADGAQSFYLPNAAGEWVFRISAADSTLVDTAQSKDVRLTVLQPAPLDFNASSDRVDADDLVLALRYLELCVNAPQTNCDAIATAGLNLFRNLAGPDELPDDAALVIPDVTGTGQRAGQGMGDAADIAVLLNYLTGIREGLFPLRISGRDRAVLEAFVRQSLGMDE